MPPGSAKLTLAGVISRHLLPIKRPFPPYHSRSTPRPPQGAVSSIPREPRWLAGSINPLVDDALFHDEADVFERADIGERIALHGDDIRRLAGGDGTEQLRVADQIRRVHGGRLNRLHGRPA